MYLRGQSMLAIARVLEVVPVTVWKILKKRGVQRRPPGQKSGWYAALIRERQVRLGQTRA